MYCNIMQGYMAYKIVLYFALHLVNCEVGLLGSLFTIDELTVACILYYMSIVFYLLIKHTKVLPEFDK